MSRAYGSSATLLLKRETTYGTSPSGNFVQMPFNSVSLGSEQGLIDDPGSYAQKLVTRPSGGVFG